MGKSKSNVDQLNALPGNLSALNAALAGKQAALVSGANIKTVNGIEQVFIAADQLVNALIPPLDGTISYADETLSARSYRAYRDGKIFGKLTMKPINLLFFWQGPDHCYKAYLKERARKNLPAEYQQHAEQGCQ